MSNSSRGPFLMFSMKSTCLLLAALGIFLISGCGPSGGSADSVMVLNTPPPGFSVQNSGDVMDTKYVSYIPSTSSNIDQISFDIKKKEAVDNSEMKVMLEKEKKERIAPLMRSEGTMPVAGRILHYQVVSRPSIGDEELTGTVEPERNNQVVGISCDSAGKSTLNLKEVQKFLDCIKDFKD